MSKDSREAAENAQAAAKNIFDALRMARVEQ